MLWTAKIIGKQTLRLTEGTTELLVVSNACVVPTTVAAGEKIKLYMRNADGERNVVAELTAEQCQRHLQVLANLNDSPELSTSSKTAEVHLLGYFYVHDAIDAADAPRRRIFGGRLAVRFRALAGIV